MTSEIVPEQAREKVVSVSIVRLTFLALVAYLLRLIPGFTRNECLMLAGIGAIVTSYFTDIHGVLNDAVDGAR